MANLIEIIIIIGYLPCVKGYLPKSLKDTPLIVCRPLTPGSMGAGDTTGSMQRDLITGVLPYFGQRARICFAPMGATELDVKATTKRRLQIINIESYAGDRNVKFNDAMIPAGTAKRAIAANTKITVETRVMKYTCILDKE